MAEAAAEAETAAGSAAVAVAAAAEFTGVEKGAVTDEGAEAPVAAEIGAEVEIGPGVAEKGKNEAGAIRFVIRVGDDGRCYSQCSLRFGGTFATGSSFQ
mgnify:CR=1 FL=1